MQDSPYEYVQIVIIFVCNQIPPCPPRPDFDASREKLQRLGEGEGNMTKEEFKKMKQELEAYVLIWIILLEQSICLSLDLSDIDLARLFLSH